jgi:hypothetical protein
LLGCSISNDLVFAVKLLTLRISFSKFKSNPLGTAVKGISHPLKSPPVQYTNSGGLGEFTFKSSVTSEINEPPPSNPSPAFTFT